MSVRPPTPIGYSEDRTEFDQDSLEYLRKKWANAGRERGMAGSSVERSSVTGPSVARSSVAGPSVTKSSEKSTRKSNTYTLGKTIETPLEHSLLRRGAMGKREVSGNDMRENANEKHLREKPLRESPKMRENLLRENSKMPVREYSSTPLRDDVHYNFDGGVKTDGDAEAERGSVVGYLVDVDVGVCFVGWEKRVEAQVANESGERRVFVLEETAVRVESAREQVVEAGDVAVVRLVVSPSRVEPFAHTLLGCWWAPGPGRDAPLEPVMDVDVRVRGDAAPPPLQVAGAFDLAPSHYSSSLTIVPPHTVPSTPAALFVENDSCVPRVLRLLSSSMPPIIAVAVPPSPSSRGGVSVPFCDLVQPDLSEAIVTIHDEATTCRRHIRILCPPTQTPPEFETPLYYSSRHRVSPLASTPHLYRESPRETPLHESRRYMNAISPPIANTRLEEVGRVGVSVEPLLVDLGTVSFLDTVERRVTLRNEGGGARETVHVSIQSDGQSWTIGGPSGAAYAADIVLQPGHAKDVVLKFHAADYGMQLAAQNAVLDVAGKRVVLRATVGHYQLQIPRQFLDVHVGTRGDATIPLWNVGNMDMHVDARTTSGTVSPPSQLIPASGQGQLKLKNVSSSGTLYLETQHATHTLNITH